MAKALPSARYALRPVGGGDGSAEALLDARMMMMMMMMIMLL